MKWNMFDCVIYYEDGDDLAVRKIIEIKLRFCRNKMGCVLN